MRYLNFHVPGERFVNYLRGLRDGRPFAYDQFPPAADGGRPPSEAVIGSPPVEIEALALAERSGVDEAVHVHVQQVESLYVLEGQAILSLGERELRARAGAWAQVPRGVPHALRFAAPTRYLSLHARGR